jgi:hypothetical protein
MTERPDPDTAERAFRDLLRTNGLPEPDEVAHWQDAIVFGWRATKAIIVIDLDEYEGLDGLDPEQIFAAPPPPPGVLH